MITSIMTVSRSLFFHRQAFRFFRHKKACLYPLTGRPLMPHSPHFSYSLNPPRVFPPFLNWCIYDSTIIVIFKVYYLLHHGVDDSGTIIDCLIISSIAISSILATFATWMYVAIPYIPIKAMFATGMLADSVCTIACFSWLSYYCNADNSQTSSTAFNIVTIIFIGKESTDTHQSNASNYPPT